MEKNIQTDFATSKLSGMGIGAVADEFLKAKDVEQLTQAISHALRRDIPYRVVGDGNNTIFSGDKFNGLVIQFNHGNITALDQKTITVGAGTNWDQVVDYSVNKGLSGIEALSLIPGTMAGAVVQNIGAYGQQLADTLESVEVLDTDTMEVKHLSNSECQFAYRSSTFKNAKSQPLIILSTRLDLSQSPTYKRDTAYRQIRHNLGEGQEFYDPRQLRDTVLDIRRGKFPDQNMEPNCGSFFKNPIVSQAVYDQINHSFGDKLKAGEILGDAADDGMLKIRLAFVFDKLLGLNGQTISGFKLHDSNPLIVVNAGGDYNKLVEFITEIQSRLDEAMGGRLISLTPEPDLI